MVGVIFYSFEIEAINGFDIKHNTKSRVDLYFFCFSYLLKYFFPKKLFVNKGLHESYINVTTSDSIGEI